MPKLKLVPTKAEIEDAMARMLVFNPGFDYVAANRKAIEEGHKHEKCSKCSQTFMACIHFIRCDNNDCPMKDQKDKRSLLDMLKEGL